MADASRSVRDGGEAPGTQVEVRSLFYNVPARRKFLRSETTETRNIEHQLFLQALAHPAIAFSLRARRESCTAIAGNYVRCAIAFVTSTVPNFSMSYWRFSEREHRGVRVRGWIGRAGVQSANAAQQFVFVNGRTIDSGILATALREGYHTALMRGQFPVTFLFIDLDPQDVDVNVHPAKRECAFVIRRGFAKQSSKRSSARLKVAALIGSENSARRFQHAGQYQAATTVPFEGVSSRGSPPIERPIRARAEISARSSPPRNPMSLKPRRHPRLSNRPCRSRCLAVEPIPDSPAANRHAALP